MGWTGTVFTPCDAKGSPLPGVECAPKLCVGGKGCFDCAPGGNTCVGNEIHLCTDAGVPGALVKPCDVSAGEVCSNGECKRACDVVAEQPSNVGCEFWAVDLDNEYSDFNDAAGAPWGIVLSNAGGANASVTIERNDGAPGDVLKVATVKTLTLKAGEIQSVVLPTREVDGSVLGKDDGPGTWLSSNAYRITSTAPLVIYQFNAMAQIFSNDASLLIPRNGLGSVYRVLGWPTTNPISGGFTIAGIPDHSFVTIVGVTAGTKVTVTLSHPIVKGGKIPATPKGGKVEATLGPFDVLNLESDGIDGDMTGTIVESTAPVAVFSGGERGIAPYGDYPDPPPGFDKDKGVCCTDHLEEQLLPVTSMGKKFVVTRSPIRSTGGYVEPDILRFMGVAATTSITTNLAAPNDKFTLEPGKFRDVHVTTDIVVEATEPLAIGQLLVSAGYTNAPISGGDPSLTIFPPIDQWRADYLFNVPTSWDRNYVVIAAPEGSDVKIDGAVPSDCVVAPAGSLGGTSYEARRCPLKAGAHRMISAKAFGIAAYGYGPVGSYAFIGGADVKKIYDPPPLR